MPNPQKGRSRRNIKQIKWLRKNVKVSDWISLGMGLLTLGAIYLAYDANRTSKEALQYTRQKDMDDNRSKAVSDSFSRAKDSMTISIAQRSLQQSIFRDSVYRANDIASQERLDAQEMAMQESRNRDKGAYNAQLDYIAFLKKQMENDAKPYIHISQFRLDSIGVGRKFGVAYTYGNAGRMPARINLVFDRLVVSSSDTIDPSLFRPDRKFIMSSNLFCPSNAYFHRFVVSEEKVDRETFDSLIAEKKFIYFFGCIMADDDNRQVTTLTSFCYRLFHNGNWTQLPQYNWTNEMPLDSVRKFQGIKH